MSAMTAIEVRDLHHRYQGADVDALQGLSFSVSFGKLSGLLGPNGSGKSTAFKVISTQLCPQSGESFVGGYSSLKNPGEVRKLLGVTFQSPSLDGLLTVRENLEIYSALIGLSAEKRARAIQENLAFLGISDRQNDRVKSLSGGLARRAELAKTLLGEPKVLLLDEPTTGLDPAARREFWKLLSEITKKGVGILVTTHLMEEAELCDELFFIAHGKLAGSGTPQILKESFPYEVLWVEGTSTFESIQSRYSSRVKIRQESGRLRLESTEGQKLLDEIRQDFGKELKSFSWGKASLSDVYFSKTGVRLE